MKKILVFISFLSILISCGTPRKISAVPKLSPYKQDVNTIHPQLTVFHSSEVLSELHFKINSKELLYTRSDGVNLSSNVLISYRLLSSFDSKEIVDSSSARLVDVNNDNIDKYLIGKMYVAAKAPSNYYLNVTITDLNRNASATKTIVVQKDNDLNRQNFLLTSAETDVPLFRNYIKLGEEVAISYKIRIPANIYVRYYDRDFPLAAPPFSELPSKHFQYKEDSIFVLKLSPGGILNFVANRKGFYHFQCDSSSHEGFTIFNFSETFPEIKKAEDMLPPLRYITSKSEYDELNNESNKKIAIEKFWLSSASNKDRARDAIKKYYNRVQEANQYFSSYIEGWKTDRGMIFLIYGSPGVIYKTENLETWIYGEEKNVNSLSYSFVRVNNPFSDNDYTLDRSPFYKQSWFMSVDVWRQGRALQDQ